VKEGKKGYFNEYPLDALPSLLKVEKQESDRNNKITGGNFVTVSSVSGTQKNGPGELEKRFKCVCEKYGRGAAIAQVCTLYKIPVFEIRGISNITGIRDKTKWDLQRCFRELPDIDYRYY